MSRRLDKEESRVRWRELRTLWNEYDPIGVVDDIEIGREYESYVGDVLRLLEKQAPSKTIVGYLRQLVTGHIGLTWSSELAANRDLCCTMPRLVPRKMAGYIRMTLWLKSITEAK